MMSNLCKDYCFQTKHEQVKGFENGQKYCSVCVLYVTTNDLFCSCCNRKYRIKKRSRYKNKIIPTSLNFQNKVLDQIFVLTSQVVNKK